jgi:hypothetical protein
MSFRRFARVLAAASLAAGFSGCASAGTHATSTRRDRSVITAADMRELQLSNLYEVVQRLHPEWLTERNASTLGGASGKNTDEMLVQVYLDTQHAGSIEVLKQIPTTGASSIHHYSASEAEARFGSGNLNGVIQIVTTGPR